MNMLPHKGNIGMIICYCLRALKQMVDAQFSSKASGFLVFGLRIKAASFEVKMIDKIRKW